MSGGFGITSETWDFVSNFCRFAREVLNKKSDHVSKNLTAIHTLQEINQPSFPRAPRQNPSNRLMLRAHWPPWRPKSFVVASTCLRALEILDRSKKTVHMTMRPNFDVLTYIPLTPLGRDIADPSFVYSWIPPPCSFRALGAPRKCVPAIEPFSANWIPFLKKHYSLTKSYRCRFWTRCLIFEAYFTITMRKCTWFIMIFQ